MNKEDLVAIINDLNEYASPNDTGRHGEYTCKGCGGWSREHEADSEKFPHSEDCGWLMLQEQIQEAQQYA